MQESTKINESQIHRQLADGLHQQNVPPERQDSKVATEESGKQQSCPQQELTDDGQPRIPQTPKQHSLEPTVTQSPSHQLSQIQTNIDPPSAATTPKPEQVAYPSIQSASLVDTSNQLLVSPTAIRDMSSSLRSNLSASSLASSLGSTSNLASPYLSTLPDLTPLPSPVVGGDAAALRKARIPETPTRSLKDSNHDGSQPGSPTLSTSPSRRKKTYGSLRQEVSNLVHSSSAADAVGSVENGKNKENVQADTHSRNRSVSEFVPNPLLNMRPRNITLGSPDAVRIDAAEYQMHRERYLAGQRGMRNLSALESNQQNPTPPASTSSVAESDDINEEPPYLEDGTASEFLHIHCGIHNQKRKFRQLRRLGQGTFSTVMLATREKIPAHPTPEIEAHLDINKLVAVKIVQHGPAGGADEERIEVSLKREVEMLKTVCHPSLIQLKACEHQASRSLLVLTYCPGGDLFEFATNKRELLTPPLIQRMFAELVSAVQYLHANWIVHRDIKLENVLVNLPEDVIRAIDEPRTFSSPIITLTDLGLSRKMPEPPADIFLHTRCGSEDYAAPEILLGQPYDGRATDAWALGVLLYALIEGRLPFDPPPGRPDRSRNTHRIARAAWIWCRFGDEDGEWDPVRGKDYEGARPCVDGLLKKARMGRKPLGEVAEYEWVKEGIQIPGGLQMRVEDDDAYAL